MMSLVLLDGDGTSVLDESGVEDGGAATLEVDETGGGADEDGALLTVETAEAVLD